jgi:hypothetical protein
VAVELLGGTAARGATPLRARPGAPCARGAVAAEPSPAQPPTPSSHGHGSCVREERKKEDDGNFVNLVRVNYNMV